MIRKPDIPEFQSEAEEAEWWDQHREETAEWMEKAAADNETTTLSDVIQQARQRAGAIPTVSISIDPDDITRARSLAAKRGLRYQTYLQMLLHEALQREEREPRI